MYKIIDTEFGQCRMSEKSIIKGTKPSLRYALDKNSYFIYKSNKIHNSKYSYPKLKYIKSNKKVIITCKKHGDFLQTLNDHLKGYGCMRCYLERSSKNKTKTTLTFIKESSQIHNSFYDYSKCIYKRSNQNVTIICPIHGEFEQIPTHHLKGSGCSECARINSIVNRTIFNVKHFSKSEILELAKKIPSSLHLTRLGDSKETFLKVGISKNISNRKRALKRYYPEVDIIKIIPTHLYNAILQEKTLLKKYRKYKYIPNAKFEGSTECLSLEIGIKLLTEFKIYK